MACLYPFRALRPTPGTVARVAAVPYDVVNVEEARTLAADNPLSFLHVSRAEIDLGHGTDPYSSVVYAKAVESYEWLIAAAPLAREAVPSLYVYRLRMGTHAQTGVAACFSIDEYDRGLIKKHEKTRRDKEDDRTRHILELRAQTGPVFLTYRAFAPADTILARTAKEAPLFEFEAADGIRHTLWRVAQGDVPALVAAFGEIPALYIADGHHRAASAARARRDLHEQNAGCRTGGGAHQHGAHEHDTLLAVAFPDNQMQILPYNRIVKDLAGRTPAAFLDALRSSVEVGDGQPVPSRKGDVSMYLDGRWYSLRFGPAPATSDHAATLDVSRLEAEVLQPLLGIGDVRTDKRIDFVGGIRGAGELERLVNAGKAAVAFSMFPVDVTDLMQIADNGGIMPPKSTWFEPKLRDGLLIHVI